MTEIRIAGLDELDRLARQLHAASGGELQRKLKRELETASRPIKQKLAQAVLKVEVTSSRGGHAKPNRSTGLRRRMAAAIEVRPTADGVRFVVNAQKVDPTYGAALSRYSDGEVRRYRRWRHPVFADRANQTRDEWTWVTQTGSPWFFNAFRNSRTVIEVALKRAVDAAARDITG